MLGTDTLSASSSNCIRKTLNAGHKERLQDLLVIGQDTKAVNKVKKAVITFHHDLFPNEILYCCPRFAKVIVKGPAI